jgi:hypothetical protein
MRLLNGGVDNGKALESVSSMRKTDPKARGFETPYSNTSERMGSRFRVADELNVEIAGVAFTHRL